MPELLEEELLEEEISETEHDPNSPNDETRYLQLQFDKSQHHALEETSSLPPDSHINQISNTFSEVTMENKIELIRKYLKDLLKSNHDYSRKQKPKTVQNKDEPLQQKDKQICSRAPAPKQSEWFKFDVTCTPQAKNFLLRDDHILVRKAACVISDLANGRRNDDISKVVKGTTEHIKEARLNDESRLLWRLDPTYSPRRKAYCNVIQVLDVVLDHDKISRAVKAAETWIKRGKSADNVILLQCIDKGKCDAAGNCTASYFKQIEHDTVEDDSQESVKSILMRNDGGVIPSFSLSETTIKLLFNQAKAVFGLPLKVSWEEDKIISFIDQEEEKVAVMAYHVASCVCIGRSGTGKTTCCLMRLVNEFLYYWRLYEHPVIPRQSLCHTKKENYENASGHGACDECDHLHQVFITKSPHLCNKVQEKFHEIISEEECAHCEYKKGWSHKHLTEVRDDEYPLFITSRDFLILLDVTIDGEPFFSRKSDGSLSIQLRNSEYLEGNTDAIWCELSSDSEFEDDDDQDDLIHSNSLPVWTEIGATYFKEIIWPSMPNRKELKAKEIDPIFVWQEIKSFIKGSVEALMSKDGCLEKIDYINYGERKAPSFMDQRGEIYTCFEHYNKHCKHDGVFDECDLIHNNIYEIETNGYRS